MSEPSAHGPRLLPPAGVVATILVAAGVLLWMSVSRGLLIVAGVGAFGPGLLREVGWLRDHDEFQREAARRAGYHAYLVGGLSAILVLSFVEWGGRAVDESAEWVRFLVVVMWLSWLASTLLTYWGPVTTAARVLRVFGSFWAIFVVATLIGEARSGQDLVLTLEGIAAGIGILAPFFGLAWTARRWPRPTGLALLGIAAVFGLALVRPGPLPWSTVLTTQALLSGPVAVSGIALVLGWGAHGDDPDDEPEAT